jgi:hypothetical protein
MTLWENTNFKVLRACAKNITNGRESIVNRALDGSIYPNAFHFGIFLIGVMKHDNLYLRLVMPSW